ncbi:zinc ribbon domain-containing protein [Oscillatoria laete-virens NRMC-F 0139]|nr:zinc ribbon domain-containing protein [Oscillatoria laete-virens]MDL5054676.1 zinc ribbon domain-containing protein [Oscillatoria laete-virens NRMC-F 0139]
MPIYEYEPLSGACAKCGGRFETAQKLSDPRLTKCPDCGQEIRRIVSSVSMGNTRSSGSYADAKKAGFTVLKKRDSGVYEKL